MSTTRRELDLTTLPLAEAAAALRSLARANLEHVLRGGPAPVTAKGSVSHVAELIRLLEIEARLAEQSGAAIDTWYRQADATLSRELAREQPPASEKVGQKKAARSAAQNEGVDSGTGAGDSDASEAREEPDEPRPAVPEWRRKLEKQTQTGLMIEVARLQRQALLESRPNESDTAAPDLADSAADVASPESAEAQEARAPGMLARLVRFLRPLFGFPLRDEWKRRTSEPPVSSPESTAALLEEAPQTVLPEHVWGYVSTLALDDPRFIMDCSKALRATLRELFVMTPGGEMFPEIHVNTHWALQLLVPPGRVDDELARHDLSRLHDEAGRRVQSPDWAGFWDQWLIYQALSKLDEKTSPTESLELLRALPWVAAGGAPAKDEQGDSKLARLGWEDQRPAWLDPRNCL